MRVEANFFRARQGFGKDRKNGAGAPFRKQQADGAARNTEHHAFGEKLTNYARRTGPECGANGEFAGAAGGAREQEVGHVSAGDQQNESDRAEEHEQNAAHIADDVGLERHESNPSPFVDLGIRSSEILRDLGHIVTGLLDSMPWFETADRVHAHADAAVAKGGIGPLTYRHVDVSGAEDRQAAGSDNDNRLGLSV